MAAKEYFASSRSDLVFQVENRRQQRPRTAPESGEDRMFNMMERSLHMASNPKGNREQDGMFFKNLSAHESFLKKGQNTPGFLQTALPYTLMQGTVLPAVLLSEIDSQLPGPITAKITQSIFDSKTGKFLLVPQGSQLIGEYSSTVSNGQSRAQVVWERLIFPNTDSIQLGRMIGIDSKGASGHTGEVNNHYDKMLFGVLTTRIVNVRNPPASGNAGCCAGIVQKHPSSRPIQTYPTPFPPC